MFQIDESRLILRLYQSNAHTSFSQDLSLSPAKWDTRILKYGMILEGLPCQAFIPKEEINVRIH